MNPEIESPRSPLFADYQPLSSTFDEFFGPSRTPRDEARAVVLALERLGQHELLRRQRLANTVFLNAGVTFSVYSDDRGTERIFPFDLMPRVISSRHWDLLERGLLQRVDTLNLFLADIYGEQHILKDGAVPTDIVLGSLGYLPAMRGVRPPGGVYVHICGVDLIRGPDGEFLVLEDNARTPSGVSYVLENRGVMKRTLPKLFGTLRVRPIDDYTTKLKVALSEVSPLTSGDPRIVVLTPGAFNSAYFEHSFLARRMGCDLVQGSDLFVDKHRVYVKTTAGPQQVHVVYRRVDDQFLDPRAFRQDSLLGVPGLVEAYKRGNVAIANAIGNGVADDKAVYPYVPSMIRYYLQQEPILGQVPTYICSRESDCSYVLEHLDQLVVKAVDGSGGYGMLIGPSASQQELSEFRARIRATPRGFIAQPRIDFSAAPTWCGDAFEPRRLDFRPYVVTGKSGWVLPGGLTRVALQKGSYVVNSSQGGGSKDTWVFAQEPVT